eukprot:TRINITY_DN31459_c0_g1_i1.p1 TRINITY_DN31459_c0_g1~~TRINITY_DN31459_c0_g1_i1.p1  ORF type:complete len:189 (+),score=44.27 TRINITY_DN31459_c0_g1_i1:253-819(+)
MAPRTRLLPAVIAACACVSLLRWTASTLFTTVPRAAEPPRTLATETAGQLSLHRGCVPAASSPSAASSTAAVLASGASAPAVVSGKPQRTGVAAHYKVTLQTPDGEQSFECPDDVYVLDQAEEEGIELPYSCRAGSCSSCTGKVLSGSIDNSDQAFLDDDQMGNGYCLLCTTYVTSDATIKTHCEDEL